MAEVFPISVILDAGAVSPILYDILRARRRTGNTATRFWHHFYRYRFDAKETRLRVSRETKPTAGRSTVKAFIWAQAAWAAARAISRGDARAADLSDVWGGGRKPQRTHSPETRRRGFPSAGMMLPPGFLPEWGSSNQPEKGQARATRSLTLFCISTTTSAVTGTAASICSSIC